MNDINNSFMNQSTNMQSSINSNWNYNNLNKLDNNYNNYDQMMNR